MASQTCQTTLPVTHGAWTSANQSCGMEPHLHPYPDRLHSCVSASTSTIDPHPTTTFGMEGPTGKTELGHRYRCLCMSATLPMSAARSFSQTPHLSHLSHLVHIATVLGMGRQPWATPAQLEYLRSWLPHLPRAKKTTSLQTAYIQAYEGFLVKWQPEPIVPVPDASPEQLAARAKKKLLNVCSEPPYFPNLTHSPPAHCQLVQGGTKEGETLSPPPVRDGVSCPRLIRQIEAQETPVPTSPGVLNPPLETSGFPASP